MAALTMLGIGVTVVWIVGGYYAIIYPIGVVGFLGKGPDLIGNFLSGFFAPLAFLWLVIGYFQQGKEISQNTQALKLQNEEMVRAAQEMTEQTHALRQNQESNATQTFIGLYSLMMEEMKNEIFEMCVALGRQPKNRQDAVSIMHKIALNLSAAEDGEFFDVQISHLRDKLVAEGCLEIVSQYVWKFDYLLELSSNYLDDRYFYRFLMESQYFVIFDVLAKITKFQSHFTGLVYCSRPGEA